MKRGDTALQSATPVFLVDDIATTMEWYKANLGFDGEAVPPRQPYGETEFEIRDPNRYVLVFAERLSGLRRRRT